jgi:UDP-N-acetylglucosamine 2-epimerase (non-hydrolysing)
MTKLLLVAGARPNFMKIAPIIRELQIDPDTFQFSLVHTGQHYDDGMSQVFFRELGIPEPNYDLGVGSGSHAQQTANIMRSFEPICLQEKPDCVVVVGDVNSTLACTLVAKKLNIKVAHIEAGLRSGDMLMPEEINRIATDSVCDYLFVTEDSGLVNLRNEGHSDSAIFFVGHVMIDNLMYELAKIDSGEAAAFAHAALKDELQNYGVVTLHRPSNVDQRDVLESIVGTLNEIAAETPLVFPVHPRTSERLRDWSIELAPNIVVMGPLGYRDFLYLWKDAMVVLTDSGGLQEETTALGIPCLTLRTTTERPITVSEGTNIVVGLDRGRILEEVEKIRQGSAKIGGTPPLWDGNAATRIVTNLRTVLS